jgi:hypothetical protein
MKVPTILLVLLASSSVILAQESSPKGPAFPLWEPPLPKSQGAFALSLNSICSVSLERYDLEFKDKSYPVTECSVMTVGGKTVRFYYVEEKKEDSKNPIDAAKESVKSIVSGNSEEEDSKKFRVVKLFPHSSQTGTVEYRLSSEKKITDIYQSLRDAWVANAP